MNEILSTVFLCFAYAFHFMAIAWAIDNKRTNAVINLLFGIISLAIGLSL